MNRERQLIVQDMLGNLPAIDKALDTIAEYRATTYAMLILQERLFHPELSENFYGNIENRSDFLAGANAVLEALTSLPDALQQIMEEEKKKTR